MFVMCRCLSTKFHVRPLKCYWFLARYRRLIKDIAGQLFRSLTYNENPISRGNFISHRNLQEQSVPHLLHSAYSDEFSILWSCIKFRIGLN
jgi:hypothetical protein